VPVLLPRKYLLCSLPFGGAVAEERLDGCELIDELLLGLLKQAHKTIELRVTFVIFGVKLNISVVEGGPIQGAHLAEFVGVWIVYF
jgi:hypothetical protein